MASRIAIVQHGEKLPKPGNPGLSAVGRHQALSVARKLSVEQPAAIISSPLLRGRQTARPLSEITKIDVRIEPRLRERLNLEAGDDPDEFAAIWQHSTDDRAWTPNGGRNSNTTADEVLAVINGVAREGALVVLFSHGGATVDLLRTLIGDEELERRRPGLLRSGPPPVAITRLTRHADDDWAVAEIAETTPANRP